MVTQTQRLVFEMREVLRSVSPPLYNDCYFLAWRTIFKICVDEIQHRERAYVIYKQLKELGQLTEWNQIPDHIII
jgi:hypothetical protein